MRRISLLFFALLVVPAEAQTPSARLANDNAHVHEAAGRGGVAPKRLSAPGFDATYYALDLNIALGSSPYLKGRVRVSGKATAPGTSTVELDLLGNMLVDSVRTPAGAALGFLHQGDILTVTLDATADSGAKIGFDVFYQGVPVRGDFGNYVTGSNTAGSYVWTLSEPYGARAWWPNRDHPSDKADSVDVTVRVPDPVRVGSNGLLVAETPHGDGTTTYAWQHRYPISSYLVFLAGGVYDVTEETYVRPDSLADRYGALQLPVLHYAYAGGTAYTGDPAYPTYGWKHLLDIFPVAEHWFGPYPFDQEKYGHAQVTFGGGMEHQTMSSMGGSGIGLISHELAHMWFGDRVTNRSWRDLWLHEGFATLGELLYWEARQTAYGPDYAYIKDLYFRRALLANGTLVLQDTTRVSSMFSHARVYAKGWMVLRMLRGMVGDETFRTVLQTYLEDPEVSFGTARTDDFKRVAEKVSGRDLGAFFSQWVTEGDGYPIYEATWSKSATTSGYEVRLTLKQTQTEGISQVSVFEMPVQVVVHTDLGPHRFVVDQQTRTQTFTLSVDSDPRRIEIDPDRWILRAPDIVVTDTESVALPSQVDLRAVYPNPVADRFEIEYELPVTDGVSIRLFDVAGREVRVLHQGQEPPGVHRLQFDVSDLSPGYYAIRLSAGAARLVRSLVIRR